MPRGLAPDLSQRDRGSCSTPQCSERPLVEVPWPGRPSIEGRNISAGPPISGAAVSLQSARTCIPQPICVLPRVPDYSEDNTSFPKVLLASSRGPRENTVANPRGSQVCRRIPAGSNLGKSSHPIDLREPRCALARRGQHRALCCYAC
jgi:hypothetical protein